MIEMKKEPWISANEAAEIISANSGKTVHPDYVRLLSRQHPEKLASKPLDGRTNIYLRTDVEKIVVKSKRKSEEVIKPETPIAEKAESVPTQQKLVDDTDEDLPSQIRNVERFEDMPTGSLKRRDFAKKHGIHNPEFGTWLDYGLKGDRLPVTYYTYHKDKAAAFTPSQQEEVLEILKKHGKLK